MYLKMTMKDDTILLYWSYFLEKICRFLFFHNLFEDVNHHVHNIFFRDSKKKLTISYPCVMLNVDVARNNTNDQYQVC